MPYGTFVTLFAAFSCALATLVLPRLPFSRPFRLSLSLSLSLTYSLTLTVI